MAKKSGTRIGMVDETARRRPTRVMTKASKAGCRSAGGLRRKLGEDFLARLNRSWELHGREILARVRAERPELYFEALVKLTLALHRATGEPTDSQPEAQSRGGIATPRSANS
jgi:hypothetical protein